MSCSACGGIAAHTPGCSRVTVPVCNVCKTLHGALDPHGFRAALAPNICVAFDPAVGPDSTVMMRFEAAPDGTTRAYMAPEQPATALCRACLRPLHAHAKGCPLVRRAQLASYRVTFELPPGTNDLRADDALERAEKLLRDELRGLVAACPALEGFTMTIERVDE